ncbi:MAG TPA: two-component system response regulator [Firmicutes bacterium]|jgi:response regulator RpfG family c-di-GMP phosphodiesterase|nr:two-component system response regulator [Bacillota bacterium]
MQEKILLVDDDFNLLAGLQRNLRYQFPRLAIINGGMEGLELLKREGPFAAVVSDYRMPGMDGIEFLVEVKKLFPNTARIMLTGQADLQASVAAMNQGNLFRFLLKPCNFEEIVNALNAAVEQHRLILAEKEILEQTLHGSIQVLNDILELIGPEAFSRAGRIRNLAERIASRLQLKNLWEVEIASMLSQIGCVTVPSPILHKRIIGQPLSSFETAIYQEYPIIGWNLLKNIPRLEGVAEAIRYQEKQYDGGGVPKDDLKGEEIPFLARLIKVASDFDLMKQATAKSELQVMKQMKNHWQWYDPMVLNTLEADLNPVEENHPVYEIKTGEILIGMVVAENISDRSGVLLVPKGQEITAIIKKRLLNFLQLNNVDDTIKIYKFKMS